MERELKKTIPLEEVATSASRNFGRVFNSQMLWLESLDDLLSQAATVTSQPPQSNEDTPARPPKELRDLRGDGSELA
jgi:hypothetical protein